MMSQHSYDDDPNESTSFSNQDVRSDSNLDNHTSETPRLSKNVTRTSDHRSPSIGNRLQNLSKQKDVSPPGTFCRSNTLINPQQKNVEELEILTVLSKDNNSLKLALQFQEKEKERMEYELYQMKKDMNSKMQLELEKHKEQERRRAMGNEDIRTGIINSHIPQTRNDSWDNYSGDNDRRDKMNDQLTRRQETPIKTTALPRNITFSGKEKWSTYESQINRFFNMHNTRSGEAQLYYISASLTGDASVYYERMATRMKFMGKNDALRALRERYEEHNLSQSRVLEFNTAKQLPGEQIQEFEDRLNRIADQAYPYASEQELEGHIMLRFTMGLINQEAARHIMCQNAPNMRETMNIYRLFTYAQTALGKNNEKTPKGLEKTKVCTIHEEREEEENEEIDVCQINRGYQNSTRTPYQPRNQSYQTRNPSYQNGGNLRELVEKLAITVNKQGEQIENLVKIVTGITNTKEADKLSEITKKQKTTEITNKQLASIKIPGLPENNSGKKPFTCYVCGHPQHKVFECPIVLEYRDQNNIRATSISEEYSLSLNENGLTSPTA